uniref:IpaC/SipC family type III secretion system effector n=1 Tax=Yersinia frederiksenii TaxID=29484 RepID=UPI001F4C2231|nr:IpaC/SipC family type III secretion system effector [Yersinia frederiksenii]ULG19776.1 hypothetical protein 49p1_00058 [Yersinia frederiksenii]
MSMVINNTINISKKNVLDSENINNKSDINLRSLSESTSGSNFHLKNVTGNLAAGITLRSPSQTLSVDETAKLVTDMRGILDNLSKLSPAILEILATLMQAFKDSNTAFASLSSDLTLIVRDLTSNVSDSIKKQGESQMIGAIGGAAASFSTATIGTIFSFKGLGKQVTAANTADMAIKNSLNMNAQKLISGGQLLQNFGNISSSIAQGVTANRSCIAVAEQKTEEQNASVTQSIKENTTQEKEKVKEFKEFLLRLVQVMVDDIKQARDAAAMGCKI